MQIAKWGNSYAVRLPKRLVEALGLKLGDEVTLVPAGERTIEVVRHNEREAALARLMANRFDIPEGVTWTREEMNER